MYLLISAGSRGVFFFSSTSPNTCKEPVMLYTRVCVVSALSLYLTVTLIGTVRFAAASVEGASTYSALMLSNGVPSAVLNWSAFFTKSIAAGAFVPWMMVFSTPPTGSVYGV